MAGPRTTKSRTAFNIESLDISDRQ